MTNFFIALQFLTVVPIRLKKIDEKHLAWSTAYFPAIGALIGLALAGIHTLSTALNFSELAISTIPIVALIILTGGLHLDGLSDTADAFLSGKPKTEMLEIMRDPHAGVMGTLTLISAILIKISFLSSTHISLKTPMLVLMCILSRWSAVCVMFFFPYARQNGKAKTFISGMNPRIFFFSLMLTVALTFASWRFKGLLALLIVTGSAYIFGCFSKKKIGGVTGDIIGATIELTEILTLFTICIS